MCVFVCVWCSCTISLHFQILVCTCVQQGNILRVLYNLIQSFVIWFFFLFWMSCSIRSRAKAPEGSFQAFIHNEWMYDRKPIQQGGAFGRGTSQTCTGNLSVSTEIYCSKSITGRGGGGGDACSCCWLLIVQHHASVAQGQVCSDMLPDWASCGRSSFLSCPVTMYWGWDNQSQHWP